MRSRKIREIECLQEEASMTVRRWIRIYHRMKSRGDPFGWWSRAMLKLKARDLAILDDMEEVTGLG